MLFGQKLYSHRIFKRIAKALIRLRVCAGWSEPLLVAHTTLLEISCHGSNVNKNSHHIRPFRLLSVLRRGDSVVVDLLNNVLPTVFGSSVHSSFAIVLKRKTKLVALLLLSYRCKLLL